MSRPETEAGPRPAPAPERRRYSIFDRRGRHLRDASGADAADALMAATRSAARCLQPWPAPGESVVVRPGGRRSWSGKGTGRVMTVPDPRVIRAPQ